jgi:hypothetical protein
MHPTAWPWSGKALARAAVAAGTVLAAVTAEPGSVAAAVTQEQAAARIGAEYDVEVLRVRAGTLDERAVWFVVVMKGAANANDAFQVTTLAVDKETGELVSTFRHGPNGVEESGDRAVDTQIEQRPSMPRSPAWR